jgi:hypothetical protein
VEKFRRYPWYFDFSHTPIVCGCVFSTHRSLSNPKREPHRGATPSSALRFPTAKRRNQPVVELAAGDQQTQSQAIPLADYFLPVETVLLFVSRNVPIFKEPSMEWTTPQHEEIDLNCEISSYANAEL